MSGKLLKSLFSFLFFCFLQSASMENNNDENIVYISFCQAVELAKKNHFSIENCEIIKNYIIQGADPNWKIGEDDEILLNLAVRYQKRDLFDFLLQYNADINAANKKGDTPFHTLMNLKGAAALELNISIDIEDLLKNGANFRAENHNGTTPLLIASFLGNSNDVKTLIKCGADINGRHSINPLMLALCNKNPVESIKELCKLGALVTKDEKNNNTFHYIANPLATHYIKPLITHARFDNFGKGSQTVPFALWVLKHWETKNMITLPKDVKLHILSNLPLSDLYPYKKLCAELLQQNYHHILLPAVHERVENITQILASPNNENETALQFMLGKFAHNQDCINNLRLLDGSKLRDDYEDFIMHFPAMLNSEKEEDKDNLANQMFHNCAELFLE